MGTNSLDDLLSQLETIAPKYGRLATQLSESIVRIEQRLVSLASKTACRVVHGAFELSFARRGDKWILLTRGLSPVEVASALRTAPVEVKIKAVELIEPLLTIMLGLQRERLNALEAAATIGTDLAKRLDSSAKEGDQ